MDPSRNRRHSHRVATCRTILITNQFSIFIRGLRFVHTLINRDYRACLKNARLPTASASNEPFPSIEILPVYPAFFKYRKNNE